MKPVTAMKASITVMAAALLALALSGCDAPDAPAPQAEQPEPAQSSIPVSDWQQQHRQQFEAAAARWQQALVTLDQEADQSSLDAARLALADWYDTFTAQTLLLNARACQLDQQALLERMDSWPLYPGYIDAMPQWPESGLISDPYLEMDRKTLRLQHGATDAAEASLGFAAMLVVLNGTGEAPRGLEHFQGEDNNAPRRLRYLKLAGEQAVADYQSLSNSLPVSADNLDCALSRIIERHQKLASSAVNDDELVIPDTVRRTVNDRLLASLEQLPDSAASAWNESRPGLLDTLAASAEEGWGPLEAWQLRGDGE